jgi:ankyrin repeat protein
MRVTMLKRLTIAPVAAFLILFLPEQSVSQQAPGAAEAAAYRGLHAAAYKGDLAALRRLLADPKARRAGLNRRDGYGRTPLMVATHRGHVPAAAALIKAGANLNALDKQRYDALTIAGVAGNLAIVRLLLKAGAKPGQTTSPYDGTALIATAHRGHVEIVKALIAGGAPLDHVNNLGWTALIEAIVLGDGGPRHTAIVAALVKAGANLNLADRQGARPLSLARGRGYKKIAVILEKAGAKP